jgi:hypothetical protein
LGNQCENESNFSNHFEVQPVDWSLFDDENLLRFLNGPFDDTDDLLASMIIDPNIGGNPSMIGQSVPTEWEPPSFLSTTIVQALLDKATYLHVSPEKQSEISYQLNFIFTPSRITKFISLYFEYWHPHCPFLHESSFNSDIVPLSLLIAVILMGATYSKVDQEVRIVKHLLDLAELYIYSMEDLTDDFEIRRSLGGLHGSASSDAFQHLQAAYLTVTIQFWGGNMKSRKRVVETRFGIVVKV